MTASVNTLLSDLDEADNNLSGMVSPGGTVASKAGMSQDLEELDEVLEEEFE